MAWKCEGADHLRCGAPTTAAITSPYIYVAVSGTSSAFKSIEASFQQDLNGEDDRSGWRASTACPDGGASGLRIDQPD